MWVSLKLELMDREIAAGKAFGEYHTHVYLAWTHTLARLLKAFTGLAAKSRSAEGACG